MAVLLRLSENHPPALTGESGASRSETRCR